jgi:hypothetical protein
VDITSGLENTSSGITKEKRVCQGESDTIVSGALRRLTVIRSKSSLEISIGVASFMVVLP